MTTEDIDDISDSPQFLRCDSLPRVVVEGARINATLNELTLSWRLQPGCVSDIAIRSYLICLVAQVDGKLLPLPCDGNPIPGDATSAQLPLGSIGGIELSRVNFFLDVFLSPKNREYGELYYSQLRVPLSLDR